MNWNLDLSQYKYEDERRYSMSLLQSAYSRNAAVMITMAREA